MPSDRGLPWGRPGNQPPQAQFLDERRRSLATTVPKKCIIFAYLTASEVTTWFDTTGLGKARHPYFEYALCNGNNDTPNMADRFVRVNNTAAGATGGSDSSAHTHAIDHDHPAVTSGAPSATDLAGVGIIDVASGNHTHSIDVAAYTGTSGAASVTENRPAYYELVAVMRVR